MRLACGCPFGTGPGSVAVKFILLWLMAGTSPPAPLDGAPFVFSLRSDTGAIEGEDKAVVCPGPAGGRTRCKERASDRLICGSYQL